MESNSLKSFIITFFLVLHGYGNNAELTDCIDTPGGAQYSSGGGSHSSYYSSGSSSSSSSQFGESGSAHSSLFPSRPSLPILSSDSHHILGQSSLSSGNIASTFQQLKQKADQFVEKGSGSVGLVHSGWGSSIGTDGFSSDVESHNVLGSGKFVNAGSEYQEQQSSVNYAHAPSPVAGYGYHAQDRYSGQTYNQALTAPHVVSETKESESLSKSKVVKVQSSVPQQVQSETHIGDHSLIVDSSLPSSKLYKESHAYQGGSSGYSEPVEVFSPSSTYEKSYIKTSEKEGSLTKPGAITEVKYSHGESSGSSDVEKSIYTSPIIASSETGTPTQIGSVKVTVKKTEEVVPSYVYQPSSSYDSHQSGYSQTKTSETAPITTYTKVVYPSYVTSEKKSSSISEKTSQSSGVPVQPLSGGYQTGYTQTKTSETIPITYSKVVYPSYVTSEKKSTAISGSGSQTSGVVVVPGSSSSSGYYSREGYYEKSGSVGSGVGGQYSGVSGQTFGSQHTGASGQYIGVIPSESYTQHGSQSGSSQYSQSSGVAGVPLVHVGGERYTSGSQYSSSSGSHSSGYGSLGSGISLGSLDTDTLCSGCVGSYQVGSQPSKKTYGLSSSWSSSSQDINGQKSESRHAAVTVNDNGKIDTYERHTK